MYGPTQCVLAAFLLLHWYSSIFFEPASVFVTTTPMQRTSTCNTCGDATAIALWLVLQDFLID